MKIESIMYHECRIRDASTPKKRPVLKLGGGCVIEDTDYRGGYITIPRRIDMLLFCVIKYEHN